MAPILDTSCRERARNLLFLSTPALWPAWPFLPLMRRQPGCEEECGLPYDLFGLKGVTGYSSTVLLRNHFQLPPTESELLALPRAVYGNAEEVYGAGWRV